MLYVYPFKRNIFLLKYQIHCVFKWISKKDENKKRMSMLGLYITFTLKLISVIYKNIMQISINSSSTLNFLKIKS